MPCIGFPSLTSSREDGGQAVCGGGDEGVLRDEEAEHFRVGTTMAFNLCISVVGHLRVVGQSMRAQASPGKQILQAPPASLTSGARCTTIGRRRRTASRSGT